MIVWQTNAVFGKAFSANRVQCQRQLVDPEVCNYFFSLPIR